MVITVNLKAVYDAAFQKYKLYIIAAESNFSCFYAIFLLSLTAFKA